MKKWTGMLRRPAVGLRAAMGIFALVWLTASGMAQGKQLTAEDYARAEKFLPYNVNPLVYHGVTEVNWMEDGRFWYRDYGPEGVTYLVVDPASRAKKAAFDAVKLAAALKTATGGEMKEDAAHLEISEIALLDHDKTLVVTGGDWRKFRCDLSDAVVCKEVMVPGIHKTEEKKAPDGKESESKEQGASPDRYPGNLSPDKTRAAFIRDWNLWVRDLKTGRETQLTTDGVKDFGYATENEGIEMSDHPLLVWSPDSKKIATYRQDQRKVGEVYLVPVTLGHPELKAWKYPLAGDKEITMLERVIIDLGKDGETPKVIRLKMPPDPHRSSLCVEIKCGDGDEWTDVQWSADGAQLAFVSMSRDYKHAWMRVADAATGEVREVMNESAATFFESGSDDKVNWKYLPKTNELIWFSQRDNWGQLYLYDSTTGRLKNQITHGEGDVRQLLQVDEKTRTIYFVGVGKEAGRDPYFQHYYSIRFDGSGMKLLTPENADHEITSSPDGRYFVDVYSTATQPQTTVVRDANGKRVVEVAKQDISKLLAAGWVPPTPITVKARDGKTDLYGFMFKPTNFDATKKYPIVNNVYPGPQDNSCEGRGFMAAHKDLQSLAELGFVVVCIDGMGTPWRSKAFHEFYYGNLGDDTIPDQIAGMKELAARYSWIDLNAAGIYGHSGGGNATASAMFHYPDFFKVGVAESGNHDQREYVDSWAEKWTGLLEKKADGTTNYDSQANASFARNLKGKLLLIHGTMDDNVPLNNTLLVVDALMKANKDFDLLILPNEDHHYKTHKQYVVRRRWDYFVKNLAGNTPPEGYEMKPYAAAVDALYGSTYTGDDLRW